MLYRSRVFRGTSASVCTLLNGVGREGMADLPAFLASGEKARLIPVAADTSKESRAASVLLAGIMSVDDFARSLLRGVGQKLGVHGNLDCYTEVVFKKSRPDLRLRPDGLLVMTRGKHSWSAFLEAKIRRAVLEPEQIARYCELAKLNGVNAVITVSNQFAALPTHHPVKLGKKAIHGIELYHWSWMYILTEATLLLHDHEFKSPEQRYILGELVRYFTHDSVGVSTFDRMNPEWKELVLKVQTRAGLQKTSPEVENSVGAWHQEQRDLCLLMSRKLGRHVTLKLSRAHSNDPVRRLKDDCHTLARKHSLWCTLNVPDAAAPIVVCADVGRRTIACSMRLATPKDKKRPKARINWVLKQLAKADSDGIFIKALWLGRTPDTQATLADLRENPELLVADGASSGPQHFEVIMVRDLAGKFSGLRAFIENLESFIPEYYEQVGQHLRAWVSPPPKIITPKAGAPDEGTRELVREEQGTIRAPAEHATGVRSGPEPEREAPNKQGASPREDPQDRGAEPQERSRKDAGAAEPQPRWYPPFWRRF